MKINYHEIQITQGLENTTTAQMLSICHKIISTNSINKCSDYCDSLMVVQPNCRGCGPITLCIKSKKTPVIGCTKKKKILVKF